MLIKHHLVLLTPGNKKTHAIPWQHESAGGQLVFTDGQNYQNWTSLSENLSSNQPCRILSSQPASLLLSPYWNLCMNSFNSRLHVDVYMCLFSQLLCSLFTYKSYVQHATIKPHPKRHLWDQKMLNLRKGSFHWRCLLQEIQP